MRGGEGDLSEESKKEFTLTLHFVSCRLPSWLSRRITKDLHPRQQAVFKTEYVVEGDYVVGRKFNVTQALDIAEKLPTMKSGQIKMSNLRKNGFYLYIPKENCHYFRRNKNEDAKIKCSFENGWLKLYYLPEMRLITFESAFR